MQRLWQLAHNALAHPLEGLALLVLGRCPKWVDYLHDWTASKAWPTASYNGYETPAGMLRVYIDLPRDLVRDYPELASRHAARHLQQQVGRICELRWGVGMLVAGVDGYRWQKTGRGESMPGVLMEDGVVRQTDRGSAITTIFTGET